MLPLRESDSNNQDIYGGKHCFLYHMITATFGRLFGRDVFTTATVLRISIATLLGAISSKSVSQLAHSPVSQAPSCFFTVATWNNDNLSENPIRGCDKARHFFRKHHITSSTCNKADIAHNPFKLPRTTRTTRTIKQTLPITTLHILHPPPLKTKSAQVKGCMH